MHTTHVRPQETPCPHETLFSYLRPERLKNLIFSIKLAGCGSNEGLTVFLGKLSQSRFSLTSRCRNEYFQCNPNRDCRNLTGIWPKSRLSHPCTQLHKKSSRKRLELYKIAIQFSANFPAKNTKKCAKFICKKHRKICRQITHFALFFAYKFDAIRTVLRDLDFSTSVRL